MSASADSAFPIRALVFDFDGLIVDTESAIYQAWCELYGTHGLELSLATWVECVGSDHSTFDPYDDLQQRIGRSLDRARLREQINARHHALCDVKPSLPGVRAWIERASQLGLAIGLASSSSRPWLDHHLSRLGIAHHFAAIASRDDVPRVKPDPALYLRAAELLGVEPARALAIEDSLHGVRAAKRAGMRCVAVPNPITAGLPLHEADAVLASLEEASLEAIAARLARAPTAVDARLPEPAVPKPA
jgi:putative hydrolase of the HAD superfamily